MIPFFFGQDYYDGLPAPVLSEIDGVTLYELARSKNDFPVEALKTYLEDVFRQFSEYGALYRDQRLDNFLLCDQGSQQSRVMVVDLEQVDFPDRLHPWERLINSDGAMSIMQDFEDMRYPHREPSPVRIWRVSGWFWDQFWPNRKFAHAKDWVFCAYPPADMDDTRDCTYWRVNTFGTSRILQFLTFTNKGPLRFQLS